MTRACSLDHTHVLTPGRLGRVWQAGVDPPAGPAKSYGLRSLTNEELG